MAPSAGAVNLIVNAELFRRTHNLAPSHVVVMRIPVWLFEVIASHADSALALGRNYVAVVPADMRRTRRTYNLTTRTVKRGVRVLPPRWRDVTELEKAGH